MTIIRNPITTGLTLTASYANPIVNVTTITNAANTGALSAVYADSSTRWNVDNFGLIGDGLSSYCVRLKGGGNVFNGAPGATAAAILGASVGIYLSSGTVANFGTVSSGVVGVSLNGAGVVRNGSAATTAATIIGPEEGIVLTAGGTITNFGTISSAGNYGQGIDFGNGTLTNGSAGSTTALIAGVSSGITALTATIANFATVTANGTVGNGVLAGRSTLTNGSAGSTAALISGVRAGISGDATVTNFGTVSGTGAAGKGITGPDGSVTNGSAASTKALISGVYSGISFNMATITNFGTIEGTGSGAEGVYLVKGKVTNGSAASDSAMISGGLIGIEMEEAGAAVGNFGTIEGALAGVLIDSGGTVANGGSSDHAAAINGGLVGVYAFAATTVTNFGTIAGYELAVSFGSGNDRLIVEPGAVFKGAVSAGGGGDSVTLAGAGTQHIGNFSGFETFTLSGLGSNKLVLGNGNFAGVTGDAITVTGGSAADTIDASPVTGSNLAILKGGAGNDVLIAGGDTTMTGGSGANVFVFTAAGSSRISDFATGTGNTIELRDAGFNLGVDDGHGKTAPQHLDASVFIADKTGAFTTTGQRFAYATSTGVLSYDADGSGTHFAASTVATLTGHPALSAGPAGNVFFVS